MNKDTFRDGSSVRTLKASLASQYRRKYRALFNNVFTFDGFDYDIPRFIMNKIFDGVALASFKLVTNPEIQPVGFAQFTEQGYDLYSNPVNIHLLNQWNSPLIPSTPLLNRKDCALLKPDFIYSEIVETYIVKLVSIEMTQRTNLILHKMPFIVTNPSMEQAIEDVIDDKEVIAVASSIADNAKSMQTNTPYIIDKLQNYKLDVENELLNILGIKSIKHEKAAQMNVDETNMAEQESTCYQDILFDKLTAWLDETNRIFGTSYSVSLNQPEQENEEVVVEDQPVQPEPTPSKEEK